MLTYNPRSVSEGALPLSTLHKWIIPQKFKAIRNWAQAVTMQDSDILTRTHTHNYNQAFTN